VCISPKPNGKKRPIGIPTVQDRVVQQAIRCVIEPSIDETFEECSYGFRPGKSAHQALQSVYKALIVEKLRWIIQIDLGSFFDTIPHERIVEKLQEHNVDAEIIRLVRGFLGVGVMEDGITRYSTTGTPQGGIISPLLANLVLDEVDTYVISHGHERLFIHKKKSYLDNAQYPNSFFKESGYTFLGDMLMSYKPKPVQGTLRF
jgi:group II intron reverse transcriptase/maturase